MDPESGGPSFEERGIIRSEVVSPDGSKGILLELASQTKKPDIPGGFLNQDKRPEDDKDGIIDENLGVSGESNNRGSSAGPAETAGLTDSEGKPFQNGNNEIVESPSGLSDIPEKRTAQFIKAAHKELIKSALSNGAFDENPDLKEKAQLALSYKGEEGSKKSSDGLRANIDVLETIGDEASGTALGEITPHVRISLGDEVHSFNEWEKKLASTTDPIERANLKEKGKYFFEFPEETSGATSEAKEKTLDQVFDEQERKIQERIQEAKGKKEDTSKDEAFLAKIRLVREARGNIGEYFKQRLLVDFAAAGEDFLEELINDTNEKATAGKEELVKFLAEKNLKQNEIAEIVGGNLDSLVQSGIYKKLEGLDELIFGRKMTEDEVGKLLSGIMDKNKVISFLAEHKKDIGVGIGGLILLIIMAGMQVVEGIGGQQR